MNASPTLTAPTAPSARPWQLYATAMTMLGMALVYFAAFGGGAWHPTDYEYVAALAWRVAHGEVPYRDFIYHKPPGTLLLHALWTLLPDAWEVRASRLVFYLQMVGATLVPVLWALARGVVAFGPRLLVLLVATTAIALHNFPAMSWQTSDALFFASIGWVAWLESTRAEARRALLWRGIASASLALALLCKQSFALASGALALGVVGELVVGLVRGSVARRRAATLAATSALPGLALLGAIALWLHTTRAWPHYVAQLRSQSTGDMLWIHLFEPYRDGAYRSVLFLWALVPFARLWDGPRWRGWLVRVLAVVPWALMAAHLYQSREQSPWKLSSYLMMMLVGLACGEALVAVHGLVLNRARRLAFNPGLGLLHAGTLAFAMSCQLSLGYTSVILGVGLFGLLVHAALPQERSWFLDLAPAFVGAAVICTAMWQANVERPYREDARGELRAELGDVFVKLSGIRTSPANHARYTALRDLVAEQVLPTGRPFVALQDYPGINWLFGTRNAIGIDWCIWPEPDGFEDRILNELRATDSIAIVPKSRDAKWRRPTFESATPCARVDFATHNVLSQYVVRHWRLVGEDAFFCLYRR